MLKSVVSSIVLSILGSGQQLTPPEESAWKAIQPRIASIVGGSPNGGVAVLISDQGDFLVHRSALPLGNFVLARIADGQLIQLNFVAGDDVTQLALLRADTWRPNKSLPLASNGYAGRKESVVQKNSALIAVLPSGPIRAILSQEDKMGVLPSKRGVTLNEIRFERPGTNFGGGLVFNLQGKLVGVLGATLEVEQPKAPVGFAPSAARAQSDSGSRGGGVGGGGGGIAAFGANGLLNSLGPAQMTVAYSITPDLLSRVIDGFLSPSHRPSLPIVGLVCADAVSGGAQVTTITKGSPADLAGMQVGDVILKFGDYPITYTTEFMKLVLKQEIGATVTIQARRGQNLMTFDVKVGASTNPD